MNLMGKRIGFAISGSHCTLEKTMPALEEIINNGADITPIISEAVLTRDTKFGLAKEWINRILEITQKPFIDSIVKAEPIGPGKLLDLLIIAPCTGNIIAKLANGIIDETIVMAAKAQLRNSRPVLIAIASNDGLGLNGRNIGLLLNMKNIYFVPFGQDNPEEKANSLVSRMELLKDAAEYALEGKQIQPVLIEYRVI
jgi:dipicolinate synthase subunit B